MNNKIDIPDFQAHPIKVPVTHTPISPGEITLKLTLPAQMKQLQLSPRYAMIPSEITTGDHKEIAYCSLWYRGHLLTAMPLNATPPALPQTPLSVKENIHNRAEMMLKQVESLIQLTFEKLGIQQPKSMLDQIETFREKAGMQLPDFLMK